MKRMTNLPRSLRLCSAVLLTALLFTGCASDRRPSAEAAAPERQAASAQPAALTVITSGGFAAAYNVLEPRYEALTGIALDTQYGSSSGGAPDSIPERLKRNEYADVIILSQSSLNRLTQSGYVRPETRVDLVQSMIGMAVRDGAAVPDISTRDGFLAALRAADSIGYSASASGTYLSTVLWPRLGIWGELAPKSSRILSERVASVVARGDVEIGFQQVSEILPIAGARYAGPIPLEYQKITTFSAGVLRNSRYPEAAGELLNYLSSLEVRDTVAATGLTPLHAGAE